MTTENLSDYRQKALSSMDWALYIFISTIPVIGCIALLIWALGDGNIHRKNWARGMFLIYNIGAVLIFALVVLFGAGIGMSEFFNKID